VAKLTKKQKEIQKLVDKSKEYTVEEAVSILKKILKANFDETVELYFNLNIDPKKSDQLTRGTVVLPHGTGQKMRILVLARGEDVNKAKEAGADFAGNDEFISKIKSGWLDFDAVVATPEMMRDLSILGKVLGPRGLMPNPKAGTVTEDIKKAIEELKKGKLEFKSGKEGNIYMSVGKISFDEKALVDNICAVVDAIKKTRPQSVKGVFIKSIYISSTMGCGIKLKK
jgi:large subunit ribosomal protein L1